MILRLAHDIHSKPDCCVQPDTSCIVLWQDIDNASLSGEVHISDRQCVRLLEFLRRNAPHIVHNYNHVNQVAITKHKKNSSSIEVSMGGEKDCDRGTVRICATDTDGAKAVVYFDSTEGPWLAMLIQEHLYPEKYTD